jgi:hypothetical protein
MGHVTRDAEPLGRTLSAIARALAAGDPGPEREALAAFDAAWGAPPA